MTESGFLKKNQKATFLCKKVKFLRKVKATVSVFGANRRQKSKGENSLKQV